ncbi:MAG: DUF2723 domain-containing protein [Armatimonadetes bacterium]|nr:DUF2723 domain-containing protein [Armatimonadota bacterium]NIM22807.1 DUF2723 domain-containing protein [Armatimonadota bacterium]NIM66674.1 DUF2723 domain-containing protein [Armatimonadota bacterium]NIM75231.1 DUF2723 domain-containing protein [Armatimonadota bacterium]NIN04872.1 DUF2723 domain-containing protein [Armatimonadota bacterium]
MSFLRSFFSNRKEGRLDWTLAGLLFLGSFAVYLQTMRPSFGWGDSSELITAAYHLGVGHSPGYPSYMLFGYVFSHLPFGTIAFRMNLMSGFFGALAVALSYLVFRRITRTRLGAFLGAAAFAFTATLWDLTTEAEVYTLHAAFVAAIVLLILDWSRSGRPHLGWVALLCGISLGNHALTMLMLPALLLFVVAVKGLRRCFSWKPFAIAVAAFILGLVIYLYLPIRGRADPPPRVNNPHNLKEIYVHVAAPGIRPSMFSATPLRVLGRIWIYGSRLKREVSWAGIILGLAGMALLWRRDRKVLGLFVLLGAFNIFYAVNYSIFDIYCYYITSYWVWCAFIGVGGEFAVGRLQWLLERIQGPEDDVSASVLRALAGALVLLLPFWLVTGHWKMVDASGDREPEEFARAVFGLVEKDSIILADWWAVAPLGYLKHVEGRRPDVTLSPAFSLSTRGAVERHRKKDFLQTFPAVYATERLTYGIKALREKYLVVPEGPVFRVLVDKPDPTTVLSDLQNQPRLIFGDRLALIDWEVQPRRVGNTEMFSITLYWQSLQPSQEGEEYDVLIGLEQDSNIWAWREKSALAHGIFPMSSWQPGQTLLQRHLAYIDYEAEPGEYHLNVRVRHRSGDNHLLPVFTVSGDPLGRDARLGAVKVKTGMQETKMAHKEERIASTRRF